jgi:hypothetical protein
MRSDDKRKETMKAEAVHEETHVVFDFTGLERPDVCDLALILTARLNAEPGESVWVRALPWQTARVLQALRLDHLFLSYPEASEEMN